MFKFLRKSNNMSNFSYTLAVDSDFSLACFFVWELPDPIKILKDFLPSLVLKDFLNK